MKIKFRSPDREKYEWVRVVNSKTAATNESLSFLMQTGTNPTFWPTSKAHLIAIISVVQ